MNNYNQWFNRFDKCAVYKKLEKNPVAYFCMEYALPKNLPTYAGGLGVLAGDFIKEAKEKNFPMVAIGLFYSKKCQFDASGNVYITNNPAYFELKPVLDKFGRKIKISVPIADRTVYIQAWVYNDGTIPLYLLDTNLGENDLSDRSITDLLYVFDSERRLKQEIVLGVGGIRFLRAMNIEPSIYHMNEGHSTFLIYELAHQLMENSGMSFAEAFEKSKAHIAFTNHTLIVGARDYFSYDLTSRVLTSYADEINMPVEELIYKGLDSEKKNMAATNLALNASTKINAVSRLHAEKARDVWPEHPMLPITNGVNIKRWDKIGEHDIDEQHQKNKKKLLDYIQKETKVKWSENELLIGWARRVTGYKRPTAIFDELDRIKAVITDQKRPVKLVFAGYPHYLDEEGRWLLNRLRELSHKDLRGSMVFLENYNTDISQLLISGCDVWLNTPVVGLEACGTSTMKAALNGSILCSTNDGWIPEVDLNDIGFMLNDENVNASLIDLIGQSIAPLYYERNDSDNSVWHQKMLRSRHAIVDNFGADRMLKDYIEMIYEPILAEKS
ncbi:MAG: alpha-glucan family phosphorylase [bacterium]